MPGTHECRSNKRQAIKKLEVQKLHMFLNYFKPMTERKCDPLFLPEFDDVYKWIMIKNYMIIKLSYWLAKFDQSNCHNWLIK